MPELKRVTPGPLIPRLWLDNSVFRDDLVFLIYLYQRWIFPVDTSRPVEMS